jgi:hypothetical protein
VVKCEHIYHQVLFPLFHYRCLAHPFLRDSRRSARNGRGDAPPPHKFASHGQLDFFLTITFLIIQQRRDSGWIHTLLEEAENERMHLM